jgi:type IV pilus assembly protein PilP
MISNRSICIAMLLFLLLPGLLGLGGRPKEPEPEGQKGKSVKIERPRKKAPEEQAGQKKEAESGAEKQETKTVTGTDAAEPVKQESAEKQAGTAEPVIDGDIAAAPEDSPPESPVTSEEELGNLMIDEQEALFGGKQRLYTRKGRVDPFEPFLRRPEPKDTGDPDSEEIRRRTPQTPLERIALSQLKLTAILRMSPEKGPIAMVEDPTGKGYVVKKGTWIGDQGGQVSEILSDRIIIQEQYKDVFGKIAEREIEKKLQK